MEDFCRTLWAKQTHSDIKCLFYFHSSDPHCDGRKSHPLMLVGPSDQTVPKPSSLCIDLIANPTTPAAEPHVAGSIITRLQRGRRSNSSMDFGTGMKMFPLILCFPIQSGKRCLCCGHFRGRGERRNRARGRAASRYNPSKNSFSHGPLRQDITSLSGVFVQRVVSQRARPWAAVEEMWAFIYWVTKVWQRLTRRHKDINHTGGELMSQA